MANLPSFSSAKKRPSKATPPAVGRSVMRKDGPDKVAGRSLFADDLTFPGLLHCAIATSEHPHAYLDAVDVSAAKAAPGVVAVLTADDVPGINQIAVAADDQPLLATDKVRWHGDRLAIIAAQTPRQARAAAALVRGTYRSLPAVLDVEEALKDDAPLLHESHPTGNLFAKGCVYHGDVEKGANEADVVVEATFNIGMQEHAYLETQGCVAVPQPGGGMTLHASAQCPFYIQGGVAKILGLSMNQVRVLQSVTGGAFGGKEDYPTEPAACAALLAWHTGRPVKLVYNRQEDILWSSKRERQRIHHKMGAKKDGTLVFVEVDLYLDAGAYAGLGAIVADRGNASAVGPYRLPHVRVDTHTVYTCGSFSGAFRGFGHPQVAVATESQMDALAQKLGMDKVALRKKNLLRAGDVAPTGERLPAPVEAVDTLSRATRAAGYTALKKQVAAHNQKKGRTRLGVGLSTISYGCCLHAGGQFLEGAGALLQVHADGSVSCAVGNTEMGQGALTVLSQLAADGLGCDEARIQMKHVDTDLVPDSGPTVASRTTTMSGQAVVDAARQLKAELVAAAAEAFSGSERSVKIEGDRATSGKKVLDWTSLVTAAFVQKRHLLKAGWYAPPRKDWDVATGQGQPYSAYAYATQLALVEVDTYTGRSRVKKVVAAHDVGKAIFPAGAAGQVEGGVVQGMGYAIMERFVERDGKILNNNFTDYLIPSTLDAPQIDVVLIESGGVGKGQAAGPFGAKGIGEPSLIPIAAAVGNAIADAVGTPLHQMPFMPEDVLAALRKTGHAADPTELLPTSRLR